MLKCYKIIKTSILEPDVGTQLGETQDDIEE